MSTAIRAAVLHDAPGKLSIEDIEIASPVGREVLIRTRATGLCHSDLHYIQGSSVTTTPLVMGHEGAGVVEAIGPDVRDVGPGDRVVTFPVPYCGNCRFCLGGRMTLCERVASLLRRPNDEPHRLTLSDGKPCGQFQGLSSFAEQMLVHETAVVAMPDEMPFDRAALIGCGVSTGVGAVLRTARLRPGATVAVIGCGGIGLNCIQGAVIGGARRIVAIDTNDGKLARARHFGATDLVNSANEDPIEQLHKILGAQTVDYSFEAVGKKETYELAFKILGPGGLATVAGIMPPGRKIELDGLDFIFERGIQGSRMGSVRSQQDLTYFMDLYLGGRLKLDELVSARIPLDEINEGYARIDDGDVARSVVIFD